MATRKVLALAAAVATVWMLLAAAAWGAGPLFLVRPPITRRSAGFYEIKGSDCSYALAQGSWTDAFHSISCTDATRPDYATCADTPQRHWQFGQAAHSCGARRLSADDARVLLAGKRLVFAGDSIARNLYGAVLRLLGTPGQDVVVGHADFQHELEGGISLQFFWAPYPENLTALMGQAQAQGAGRQEAAEQQQQQQQQQEAEPQVAAVAGEEQQQAAAAAAEQQHEAAPAAEGAAGDGGASGSGGAQEGQQLGEHQVADGQEQQDVGDALPAVSEEAGGQQAGEQPGDPQVGQQAGEQPAQRRRRSLQEHQRLLQGEGQAPPELVVFSTTLWHLLHFTEPADFQRRLGELKAAAAGFATVAGSGGSGGSRLLLTSSTETFPNRMKTQQKQRNMTPANVDAYNQAMEQASLLAPAGPFSLLDLFPLTRTCGEECSIDGVHSLPVVYDAALQLLLNIASTEVGAQPQQAQQQAAAQPRRALRELPGQRAV